MTPIDNTIQFVLDGKVVRAQGERRTTTVLDYLRESLHRTGTKEGCAEGDCGACVVMLGTLSSDGSSIDYIPVNACIQLLPSIDGKALKTVESLKRPDGTLHPMQEAVAKGHGTQCGFCTPGIVMSLVNLVQVVPQPSRQQLTDALSGNLCRCTGYKPIIDAATSVCQSGVPMSVQNPQEVELLRSIQRPSVPTITLEGDILVQPVIRTRKGSEFVSPSTSDEVAAYLVSHPHATLVAGSTEVGLQVNKQYTRPSHICYLGNVKELQTIQENANTVTFGAGVSVEQVAAHVSESLPDFAEVLRRFGSPPIRSTATLAGNIVNGSPIGDSMPCLLALDAELGLRKGDHRRVVKLENFYTGQKQTALQAGEFVEWIRLQKPVQGQVFKAHKVSKRFEQDISATCAAMRFSIESNRLKSVRLAYNGLTPYPARAKQIEAYLEGLDMDQIRPVDIDELIAKHYVARDGLRATWAYRSLVARNLVLQFIEDAAEAVAKEA